MIDDEALYLYTHGDILGKRHSNNWYKSAVVLLSPDFVVSKGDGVVSSHNHRRDISFFFIHCDLVKVWRVKMSRNCLSVNEAMWSSSRVDTWPSVVYSFWFIRADVNNNNQV